MNFRCQTTGKRTVIKIARIFAMGTHKNNTPMKRNIGYVAKQPDRKLKGIGCENYILTVNLSVFVMQPATLTSRVDYIGCAMLCRV